MVGPEGVEEGGETFRGAEGQVLWGLDDVVRLGEDLPAR